MARVTVPPQTSTGNLMRLTEALIDGRSLLAQRVDQLEAVIARAYNMACTSLDAPMVSILKDTCPSVDVVDALRRENAELAAELALAQSTIRNLMVPS